TAGSALDGSGATNTASLARAALGISVSGTYNGTSSIVPTAFSTAGLLGGDTLTGLASATLNSPNVFANGTNFVTALTPSGGTANLANYQINPAYNGSVNGMGNASGTSTNVATLARAPLGVAVSGTYTGSTVLSAADGATIAAYGLVGQDAGVSLTTATLDSRNVAQASKVVAVTGSGSFDPRNYVLNGSVGTTPATAGSALDGSGATNTASLA
ncbi:MAG TPA: hypothetical protein PK229_14745, partial [Rhodocyclaceae bacterium]|nr:hypothetical protein [Rhodocyclaceae bacterium]